MPFADKAKQKLACKLNMRKYRERKKAEKEKDNEN